jgi:PAS domain S-box-containing protein
MTQSVEELIRQNEELQARLETAEQALQAIQNGEVDALVVYAEEGERIYTLEGADYTYRVMIENIFEGVATLQGDGMILYGNHRLAEMLGVPLETILGADLARFISPADAPAYRALLRRAEAGFSQGEIALQRQDGSALAALVSLSSVENKGKRVICLVATDLTEQKRSEEVLAAEKMARSILDQASEAIVVCDRQGTIIRASQAAFDLLYENPLLLPFETAFPFVVDGSRASAAAFSIREVLQGTSYKGVEVQLELPGAAHPNPAQSICLLLSATALRGDRDEIIGCIVALADITERSAWEVERERLLAENRRQNALLERLIQTAPIGIAALRGPEHRLFLVNPAQQELLPMIPQVLGRTAAEIWPDQIEKFKPVLDKVYQTGEPYFGTDVPWSTDRGRGLEEAFYTFSYSALFDPAGKVEGILILALDTTERVKSRRRIEAELVERQRIEVELRESEARERERRSELEALMDAVPAYLWITHDPHSQEMTGNLATFELMHLPPGENLSKSGSHPETLAHFKAIRAGQEIPPDDLPVQMAALTGQPVRDYEFDIAFTDGTVRHLLGNAEPLRDEQDRPCGAVSAFIDITTRKAAEEQLAAERERFRTTLSSIGDAVITTDPAGKVTFLNPVAEKLTGWSSAEASGLPMEQVFPIINEQSQQAIENPAVKVVQTGSVIGLANHTALLSRGGQVIPIEDSAAPIRDAEGQVIGVVIVFHDVTEKRQAEIALRESQERLLMTTAATEIGLWEWDVLANRLTWDERCKALFNLPAETALTHQVFLDAVHPEDRQRVDAAVQIALRDHLLYEIEFRTEWPDGSLHWIYSKGNSIYDQAGEAVQMFGVAMEITRRKVIEEAMRASQAHIEVQHRLLEQREQERQQIARDLHDGPVQALTAATFTLQGMLMDGGDPEITPQLRAVQTILQDQINELRNYAGELRPPTLARFGLVKAIQAHIESFQEKYPGIQLLFTEDWNGPILPEELSLALFRIYQENLTNVVKHSHASLVTIRLVKTARQVVLEVHDNGAGFEVPNDWLDLARHGHLGMVGMRERAEAVGGQLEIRSHPGQGATLIVTVPLP